MGRGLLILSKGLSPTVALFLVAVTAICVMFGFFVRDAAKIDALTQTREEMQLSQGLEARISELQVAVASVTDWDDAVSYLDHELDLEWASSNIGVFLSQTGFELVFVIDQAGRPIFAFGQGSPIDNSRFELVRPEVSSILDAVRRKELARGELSGRRSDGGLISSSIQASSVAQVGGLPYVLTATLVQPDFGTALPRGPTSSIVITGEAIDDAFLATLVTRYQLSNAALTPTTAPPSSQLASLAMKNTSGQPVVNLQWQHQRPGQELMREGGQFRAMLVILLVASLVLLLWAARRTARRLEKSQTELVRALAAAERANDAKSEFLASMSHELRTPLNGIIGVLHLIKSEPLSGEAAGLVKDGLVSGELVSALINDILDYSKIEAGGLVLSPEPTDLPALLTQVSALFAVQCQDKGLGFELRVDPGIGWAVVDPLRLRQCLVNLIANAVKFTEAGKVSVSASLHTIDDCEHVDFVVTDTGVGIPQASRELIFERFKQVDGAASRRFGGTGLGLSITRNLAELMGGGVRLTSDGGAGSTFSLEVRAPRTAPAHADEGVETPGGLLEGLRILVVDDNAINRTIASKILQRLGAEVLTASSGVEALRLVPDALPDLILMDIQMPGMDGIEATRRLRASGGPVAQIPILALTANVLDHQRAAYIAAGMNGVISKPISPAMLIREIVRVSTESVAEAA